MSIRQGKIIIADSVSSTTDYQDLINKPKINGVELDGNKTTEDLNINVGITSVNGDTGTSGAVTVKAIENANPNDTMLKVWNGTTAEYLALAEKDLNTIYNVTDEVTADTSKMSGFNLFDFKWSDHLINNISWTRADNFSWHSAAVYVSAYNKLLKEKERTSTVLKTETIDDVTISFYRSENNYKICLPDQLANLTSLYEKTGVAWYYVIDTENKQFKLPRTKWGFTGLRNKAGDYVPESLPNITGSVGAVGDYNNLGTINGAFEKVTPEIWTSSGGTAVTGYNTTFDASRSSSAYKEGASVQERATEMYLYFYVGNTVTVESEVNLDTLVTDVENLKKGSGSSLEIGDIGFSAFGIDETQNKRRYLNGQVISQTQFSTFTDKVKAAVALYPSLSTTETNWQAEVTNSPYGICGKFVIDDTAGTIRLPKYPDWSIREVGEVPVAGNGMALGMTNGTKNFGTAAWVTVGGTSVNMINSVTGAYGTKVSTNVPDGSSVRGTVGVTTDPTKSGMIANLVNANTEDKLQGKWFIQVATGSEESVDVSTEIQLNNPFFFGMHIWSDTAITNASWLISNGSYHSGATYVDFYEWLLKIHNGTLAVDGVSVKAYGASDITDYDYVINTADTTFRLPVKVKLASGNAVAGNGMSLGLTDGTYLVGSRVAQADGGYGFFGFDTKSYGQSVGVTPASGGTNILTSNTNLGITTDPNKSGIETSSQGLKLYFYVGETIKDANVINAAGVLTDVANLKAHYIVETYENGKSGYRVWSDGYCEQWGYIMCPTTVVFLKTFANTNISTSAIWDANLAGTTSPLGVRDITTTGCKFVKCNSQSSEDYAYWRACGYIS